jgi:hypothetical protein
MTTCFIGFFGITRALPWTIDSIERCIFAPLHRAGVAQIHAAHFNLPSTLHAPRSGERGIEFELGDIRRLRLDRHVVEPQGEDAIAAPLAAILRVPQKGEDDADGATRRNALYQLHSLRGLGRIFADMNPLSYDAVLLLRPDLRYLDPLPVRQLLAQLGRAGGRAPLQRMVGHMHRRFRPPADMVVPAWHKWGGLNDRFAICTPDAAMAYMNRIDSVAAYCAQAGHFQSEHLLAFAMAQAGLRTADTWVRAERVRTGGRVEAKDSFAPKERLKWFLGYPEGGLRATGALA